MCGRFTLAAPEPTLRELIGPADWSVGHVRRWNVAPGQDVLTVSEGPDGRRVDAVRWGFPRAPGEPPIVNARLETAATRSLFRQAFLEGRCVVPADSFYEWRGRGGQPYRVALRHAQVFGLAAIRSPGGLAILTREAVPSLASIHHRMPVVLDGPEAWSRWLGGAAGPALSAGLEADDAAFRAHPVSRRVNAVSKDDAQCAAEVAPEDAQTTLW